MISPVVLFLLLFAVILALVALGGQMSGSIRFDSKYWLSIHEASHVVAAFVLNGYLIQVWIRPSGYTQGAVTLSSPEAQVMLFLAGGVGNEMFGGGSGGQYSDGDLAHVNQYLPGTNRTFEEMEARTRMLLDRPERRAAIEAIAAALRDRGTIIGQEAVRLAQAAGLPVNPLQGSYESWIAHRWDMRAVAC